MLLQVGYIFELIDHLDGRPTKAQIAEMKAEITKLQEETVSLRNQRDAMYGQRDEILTVASFALIIAIAIGLISTIIAYRYGKKSGQLQALRPVVNN